MPDELNGAARLDLTKLTTGEKLWLVRRRHDCTQSDIARSFGVSRWTYAKYERDTLPYPKFDTANIVPTIEERLLLARRRSGLSLVAVGEEAGISKVTVHKYEHAISKKLIAFWEHWGFTFGEAPAKA